MATWKSLPLSSADDLVFKCYCLPEFFLVSLKVLKVSHVPMVPFVIFILAFNHSPYLTCFSVDRKPFEG